MAFRPIWIVPVIAVVILTVVAATTFTSQMRPPVAVANTASFSRMAMAPAPTEPETLAPEPEVMMMGAVAVTESPTVTDAPVTDAPTPAPPPRTAVHDRADSVIAALLAQARRHRVRGFENAAVGSEDFAALLAWSAYTPRRDHTPLQVVKLKVLHPSVFKVTVAVPPCPEASAAGHGALLTAPVADAAGSSSPAGNVSGGSGSGGDQAPRVRHSTFVLKSECRPALPYDGQQALGEIGAALVLESIFGTAGAYGPYGWVNAARGVVVEVTPEQFGHMLAKGGGAGRCGLLSGHDLAAAEIHKDRWEHIHFAGAALQWNPIHYDDAMPHRDSIEYFMLSRLDELNVATAVPSLTAPPPTSENATAAPPPAYRHDGHRHPQLANDPAELEALRQMSDVMVVDFVAQSSDRVDHNWFRTAGAVPEVEALVLEERRLNITRVSYGFPSTAELAIATEEKRERFHSGKHFDVSEKPQLADMSIRTSRMLYMDNGWAFAGLAFVHSVCDADGGDLRVPRTLRFFNGTRACNTYSTDLSTCPPPKLDRPPWPLCRFRRSTVDSLKSLAARWGVAPADAATQPADSNLTGIPVPDTPVGNEGVRWAEVLREDPLMRLLIRRFHREPDVIGGQPFRRGGMQPLNVVLSRFTQDCPAIGSDGVADAADLLALGIGRRLRALNRHVSWCVGTYGVDEVLL